MMNVSVVSDSLGGGLVVDRDKRCSDLPTN